MKYLLVKSIDLDMAHHISGHAGACINLHGHTWKFELGFGADALNEVGFVLDFKDMKRLVLEPVHALLDHALLLSEEMYSKVEPELITMGAQFLATRRLPHHPWKEPPFTEKTMGAEAGGFISSKHPGGMKLAVCSFTPTSERLAQWLCHAAEQAIVAEGLTRVSCVFARVYETMHPVNSMAEYRK